MENSHLLILNKMIKIPPKAAFKTRKTVNKVFSKKHNLKDRFLKSSP